MPTRKRASCTCAAYPWPHRLGGGFCRYPDPPAQTFQGKAGKNAPVGMRRRSAIRRRLLKRYGLHPIRDREKIRRWLPKLYAGYCRRYGLPYVDWWFGGYVPAMLVTAEGPKASVSPAVTAIRPEYRTKEEIWIEAFHRDARRERRRVRRK